MSSDKSHLLMWYTHHKKKLLKTSAVADLKHRILIEAKTAKGLKELL